MKIFFVFFQRTFHKEPTKSILPHKHSVPQCANLNTKKVFARGQILKLEAYFQQMCTLYPSIMLLSRGPEIAELGSMVLVKLLLTRRDPIYTAISTRR
jgi:hypothetical protein